MTQARLRELSSTVGQKLTAQGKWLTCAESCTGGWIAKAITDIAGSSAYFDRGFITYSNASKCELLNVEESILLMNGAVSEQVVRAMAVGALHCARASVSLSVSGIAGPDGGTHEKPPGTVWFGFATNTGCVEAYRQFFAGDRESVRLQAAIFSLQTLSDKFL